MSAYSLTPIAALFSHPEHFLHQRIEIAGWLTSARIGKRVGFLVVSDGSSLASLQAVVPHEILEHMPALRDLGAGCSVRVRGALVPSLGTGQTHELQAQEVEVVGTVQDPLTYPIQPKAHSAEFLRSVPHLRHRVPQVAGVARLRHTLMRAVHDYFDELGFCWVATPILTSVDAEGAGARLRATTLEPEQGGADFFARSTYLTVSGQMEAEALCAGLSRVYTFGPTFRAEGSHTSRHLAEFWMVEPEMAFATLADLVSLAQGLLQRCAREALDRLGPDMQAFAHAGGTSISQWEKFAHEPFCVMTYSDAITELSRCDQSFQTPVAWGMDLQSEHEKWLVAHAGRPVAVVDYPTAIKSFYMKASEDGRTVQAMDILVPGMGEIIGGSVREDDADRLDARMRALGMDLGEYGQYRDLRRYGSVPHGGFGLGFERLVAYLAGLGSIKDAIAYPRVAGG